MEFLKSVPAVSGRLVTSVTLWSPSGHIARSTGSVLGMEGSGVGLAAAGDPLLPHWPCPLCPQPVVEEPFEVLEERVLVLVQETLHRVPERRGHHIVGASLATLRAPMLARGLQGSRLMDTESPDAVPAIPRV